MSLSVSISQFSGGVTEVPPSRQLVANCNYLWEIMSKYGIQAMRYNGGGGVVAGIGVITATGKAPYELVVTIAGAQGDDEGAAFQHDDLINAVDVNYFLINGAPLQINMGTFSFNYVTGTVTLLFGNKFFGQDKLLIPYSKYVNITSGSSTTPPSSSSRPIQFTTTYAQAVALTVHIGSVEVASDENYGGQRSMYIFLDDGTLQFQYPVP